VVNRILATVDGEPITLYELKNFMASNPLAAQVAEQGPEPVLDALITTRMIEREISSKGIVIGDADIDAYINQIRQQNQISEEQLYQALSAQGITPEAYRNQIRQELQRAQLINREIRGKVSITPEDVERYYQAHLEEYEKAPEVTVSHIVLRLPDDAPPEEVERVEKKAEEIHAMLDDGEDFSALARQYSEDPAAESGGVLGTFRIGSMLDALDDAARDLDVGEYSQPVRSSVGIHIVRLDARSDETHTPLDELSEGIREKLYNEALEERYARFLTEDLRERHHVEMLE
jgi:peptidyl-prolyl cis-trans isomerase SurA